MAFNLQRRAVRVATEVEMVHERELVYISLLNGSPYRPLLDDPLYGHTELVRDGYVLIAEEFLKEDGSGSVRLPEKFEVPSLAHAGDSEEKRCPFCHRYWGGVNRRSIARRHIDGQHRRIRLAKRAVGFQGRKKGGSKTGRSSRDSVSRQRASVERDILPPRPSSPAALSSVSRTQDNFLLRKKTLSQASPYSRLARASNSNQKRASSHSSNSRSSQNPIRLEEEPYDPEKTMPRMWHSFDDYRRPALAGSVHVSYEHVSSLNRQTSHDESENLGLDVSESMISERFRSPVYQEAMDEERKIMSEFFHFGRT